MFDIILQVDSLATSAKATGQVESVWSLLSKGGPLMIPLGILFALAVFFFTERLLAVKKASKIDERAYFRASIICPKGEKYFTLPEAAQLRRPYCSGSNVTILRPSCHSSTAWPSTNCFASRLASASSGPINAIRRVMWPSSPMT